MLVVNIKVFTAKYFSQDLNIFSFSLHLGIQSGPCEEQLVRLDEQCNEKTYKVKYLRHIKNISRKLFQVGVMYCRAGQQTEEEMYNNEEGGPAFNEFLDLLGQRVRLKGFNKYKAGLCNKSKSIYQLPISIQCHSNHLEIKNCIFKIINSIQICFR